MQTIKKGGHRASSLTYSFTHSLKKLSSLYKTIKRQAFVFFLVLSFFISQVAFLLPSVKAAASDSYSWSQSSGGISAAYITGIVYDNSSSSIAYAISNANGIYKTTNGGTSWSLINTGLPSDKTVKWSNFPGSKITIDPNSSSILYAQIGGKVYKTTDSGSNWTLTNTGTTITSCYGGSGISGDNIAGIVVDKTNSNILYAATIASGCSGGIFKSTDAGSNWTQIAGDNIANDGYGGNDAWPLTIDPSDGNNLYVGTVYAVYYRTVSGGTTWSSMTMPSALSGNDGDAVAVDPANSNNVFMGTAGGLASSTDKGVTWSQVSGAIGSEIIYDVKFAHSDSSVVYVLSGSNIYKSTNSGSSWSDVGDNNLNFRFLAVDPNSSTTILLGSQGSGIYQSTDSGATQTAKNSGLTISTVYVQYVTVDPTNTSVYYSTVRGVGIYKSTDKGTSWSQVYANTGYAGYNKAFVNPHNGNIYAGFNSIDVSTDGGSTWSDFWTPSGGEYIDQLVFDPNSSSIIYGLHSSGMYKTTNGGGSWTTLSNFTPATAAAYMVIDPNDSNNLYVGTYDFFWKSTDGGSNWTRVTSGMTAGSTGWVIWVALDPDNSSIVYLGTRGNKVLKSTDSGTTFSDFFAPGIANSNGAAGPVLINPSNSSDMVASFPLADAGPAWYRTTDGGSNWSSLTATSAVPAGAWNLWRDPTDTNRFISGSITVGFNEYQNNIPVFSTSTFAADSSTYARGDTVTFTTNLINSGYADGANASLSITLPGSLTYVSGSAQRDKDTVSSVTYSSNILTIPIGKSYSNTTLQVTFQATIGSDVSGNGISVNGPTITSTEDVSGTSLSGINLTLTSSSSSSTASAPGCGDSKPSHAPDLFQIDATKTQATLYFTPAGKPYTYYFISYGNSSNAQQHGVQFDKNNWDGVTSFTIDLLSPYTPYYFKVRGGNGCMPGEWSNTMKATTTKFVKDSVKYYRYGKTTQSQLSLGKDKKVEVSTEPDLQLASTPIPTVTPAAPVSPTKPNVRRKTCILWNLICW